MVVGIIHTNSFNHSFLVNSYDYVPKVLEVVATAIYVGTFNYGYHYMVGIVEVDGRSIHIGHHVLRQDLV